MHQLPLLINITLALMVAFIGGVIARRLGLPTIVGYPPCRNRHSAIHTWICG